MWIIITLLIILLFLLSQPKIEGFSTNEHYFQGHENTGIRGTYTGNLILPKIMRRPRVF
jgi:hypothetical protein